MESYEKTRREIEEGKATSVDFKTYKRRWFMLFLYFITCTLNGVQWAQYSTIADPIVQYYNVSYELVHWSAMIFLLAFIVCALPGSYLLNNLDLREGLILASALQCLGCWLKIVAVNPDRFWLVLLCQALIGMTQVLFLSVPSLLAVTWFPSNEISTATSIGILATELGNGFSFVIPVIVVPETYSEEVFENNLIAMFLTIAISCSVVLITFFVLFEGKPPLPPSKGQERLKAEDTNFKDSLLFLKRLLKNRSFLLTLIVCGITNGVSSVMDILFSLIATNYEFPFIRVEHIEFILYVMSSLGPVVSGILLDRRYPSKMMYLIAQSFSLAFILTFTFILPHSMLGVCISLCILEFCAGAVYLISYETAMEVTFPIPESLSSVIFFGTVQIFSIAFLFLYWFIFYKNGGFLANCSMCAFHLLALLFICCIRFEFRRKKAYSLAEAQHIAQRRMRTQLLFS
ncbi:hypothetical protein FQA39_LY12388 [Lamprigera yunnana]|nr:hypothetical protein FQA39_LY12388 [Lamprigera yunnana]